MINHANSLTIEENERGRIKPLTTASAPKNCEKWAAATPAPSVNIGGGANQICSNGRWLLVCLLEFEWCHRQRHLLFYFSWNFSPSSQPRPAERRIKASSGHWRQVIYRRRRGNGNLVTLIHRIHQINKEMFNFWGPLSSFATGPWTSRGGAADKRSGGAAWRPTFQLSVKLVIARWWLVIRCCWWWRQRWNISDWCTYPHAFEAKRLTSKYRQRHRISNGTNWHSPITQSHSLVGTIHCSTGGSQNHVFTCNHFLWLTFQVLTCFWLENFMKI